MLLALILLLVLSVHASLLMLPLRALTLGGAVII